MVSIDELVNAVNVIKKTCSDCPLSNEGRCGITDSNKDPHSWKVMDIKHLKIFV